MWELGRRSSIFCNNLLSRQGCSCLSTPPWRGWWCTRTRPGPNTPRQPAGASSSTSSAPPCTAYWRTGWRRRSSRPSAGWRPPCGGWWRPWYRPGPPRGTPATSWCSSTQSSARRKTSRNSQALWSVCWSKNFYSFVTIIHCNNLQHVMSTHLVLKTQMVSRRPLEVLWETLLHLCSA